MSEKKYPVKRGGEYELVIEDLAFGGKGVARVENYVIFVKDALPGDRVRARIGKRKKDYAEAYLLEILQSSPYRVEAPCNYFKWCGGCTWQNMRYEHQLYFKRKIVQDALMRIGAQENIRVNEVLPSEKIFAYRNKMEFSFSDRRWLLPEELGQPEADKTFALGLHVPGTFDKILHVDHCLLQTEIANEILRFTANWLKQKGLKPYGIRSHEGFLRFLIIRQSAFNDEIMVNIVTGYEDARALIPWAEELRQRFPQVVSVVNNINTRLAQIAIGESEILLAGRAYIRDKIGNFVFNISANSFFQTNNAQAERLYEVTLNFAQIDEKSVVWDLYAGTGTISLFLAQKAKEVIGFEVVDSAVADAWQNAKEHQVDNVRFVEGDLLKTMHQISPEPNIIVADPPRSGMHEKVLRLINHLCPERMVYVSCNPTTLARDLKILSERFEVQQVQPVDMFPQTYHIETVVQLKRKEKHVSTR